MGAPGTVRFAYALTFWLFFGLTSIVLYAGAVLLFLVTLPFDPNGRAQHFYSCFWGALYVYANPFWKLRIIGRERLPLNGPAIIVSNHQSSADIFVLFSLYRPFKWVSKESMFKTPCIGWNMSLNRYVKLKRGDKDSIGRMMSTCEGWLQRGVPVLMFPVLAVAAGKVERARAGPRSARAGRRGAARPRARKDQRRAADAAGRAGCLTCDVSPSATCNAAARALGSRTWLRC
jgi:1-acyl-sn-glycerol-3-phosphate acyltransferase